ncbi:TPM domain-containing protein [Rhizobium sp. CRIBSB]|nr:TPM domain-containing protein [Rhizobium sp. CRIBSB]
MVMRFSSQDHARVAQAIASAEASTSGEIFCVFARQVSSYRDIALGWAAGAALILPLVVIPLGFEPGWLPGMAGGWEAGHLAARDVTVGTALAGYALLQAAVFVAALALTSIPAVRRWITPRSVRRTRVRRAALQQFLAHGVHVTEARTGVMIFAALADHQVEVIADEGIHSRVDSDVWAQAAAALATAMKQGNPVQGFEQAIALCGAVLTEHFPPGSDDTNEVADKLVEI